MKLDGMLEIKLETMNLSDEIAVNQDGNYEKAVENARKLALI